MEGDLKFVAFFRFFVSGISQLIDPDLLVCGSVFYCTCCFSFVSAD